MLTRNFLLMAGCAVFAASIALHGCNITETVDDPETQNELIESAKTKLDAGDCAGADGELAKVSPPGEVVYGLRGWAHLCQAGIKAEMIVRTLFRFTTNDSNLTALGNLAKAIGPQSADSLRFIDSARDFFDKQKASRNSAEAAVNLGVLYLSKAAAILNNNRDRARGIPTSDAIAQCNIDTNCSTDSANCIKNASLNSMDDPDANEFRNAILKASESIFSQGDLGAASSLINRVATDFNAATAANFTRCIIVNKILR